MIKMLRAVAAVMLLATGASAATVDGPLKLVSVLGPGGLPVFDAFGDPVMTTELEPNPLATKAYLFTISLQPSDLMALPDGWGPTVASRLWITMRGQGVEQTSSSQAFGTGSVYSFQWLWKTDGPADFEFVDGYLERYADGKFAQTVVKTDTIGPFISESIFGHDIAPFAFGMRQSETDPTTMPIAGSLPLLLSALGLGALVMRRRARAAA